MDWSLFVPTLVATFLGVFLSFTAYRLWDWYKAKGQRDVTKSVLSLEITDNMARLEVFRTEANEVLNGKGSIKTLYSLLLPVQTSAYNVAFQSGEIRRLGDSKLEMALMEYAVRCEGFNTGVRFARDSLIERFGSLRDVPLDAVNEPLRWKLANVEDLINRSHELLKMMIKGWSEPDTPSE